MSDVTSKARWWMLRPDGTYDGPMAEYERVVPEAEIERLRHDRAVLADALHWARATFRLSGEERYAEGCDNLLQRHGCTPLDAILSEPEHHLPSEPAPRLCDAFIEMEGRTWTGTYCKRLAGHDGPCSPHYPSEETR
jgi:hypothetical protein